jgi:hypothetical protein
MADYLVTGKKGAGKSLFCVGVIRDALLAGKRVATNLNIHIDHLLPASSRATLMRLPDRPNAEDMIALGRGQEGVVEDENGIIVIDEAGTFLNARSWGDKERQPLIDWLVHSRKYGWDVYFIAQGIEQLDKQVRTTLLEYRVTVTRTDKWPIPGVTPLVKLISGYHLTLPKMHIGTIRHGMERDSLVIDRKMYLAKDLFRAYDTQQIFAGRETPYSVALHSVLSAWHVKGRYLPPRLPYLDRLRLLVFGRCEIVRPPLKPKHPLVELIARLPPHERARHFRRLDSLGAFS